MSDFSSWVHFEVLPLEYYIKKYWSKAAFMAGSQSRAQQQQQHRPLFLSEQTMEAWHLLNKSNNPIEL